MPLCSFRYAAIRTVDRGCQPAPGLPCALFQREDEAIKQSSGEMRREDAKVCLLNSLAPDAAQRFFSDALQSSGPMRAARAVACWVPALRRNAKGVAVRVRDTRAVGAGTSTLRHEALPHNRRAGGT